MVNMGIIEGPLFTPSSYNNSFILESHLHSPLWENERDLIKLTDDVCGLFVYFECLCRRQALKSNSQQFTNFPQAFQTDADLLIDKIRTKISMISLKSLKDIVNTNECRLLFPFMGRHLLNNQGKDVNKTLTDEYFEKCSTMQQIISLAHQINCDVIQYTNIKYLAHQLALLYQSLIPYDTDPELKIIKNNIEENFEGIREQIGDEDNSDLPEDYIAWILEITSRIVERVEKISKQNSINFYSKLSNFRKTLSPNLK